MIELTQQEADALLALEKYYFEANVLKFPDLGGTLRLVLHSLDKREEFNLDITRGKISLEKNTFQTRARKAIVLVRLDILGPPHRNPNGEEVECPHIHLYQEGFGDKWAYPLPNEFNGIENIYELLDKFMDYCHIVGKPTIERGLFT